MSFVGEKTSEEERGQSALRKLAWRARIDSASWAIPLALCVAGLFALQAAKLIGPLPAIGLAGLLLVGLLPRSFRIGLVVDESGVRIKNYWLTREVPWSQVEAITLTASRAGPFPGTSPGLRLRSGARPLAVHAMGAVGAEVRRAAYAYLLALAGSSGVRIEAGLDAFGNWVPWDRRAESSPGPSAGVAAPQAVPDPIAAPATITETARARAREARTGAAVVSAAAIALAAYGLITGDQADWIAAGALLVVAVALLAYGWAKRSDRLQSGP
jgi:hypothetical protein